MDTTVAITADYDNGYDDDYNSYLVWVFFYLQVDRGTQDSYQGSTKNKIFCCKEKIPGMVLLDSRQTGPRTMLQVVLVKSECSLQSYLSVV